MKQYYYFTFGVGHLLKNYCIKIYGTYEETRKLMFESFGDKWAFQYSEEQFANTKYDYKEIEVCKQ